VWAAWWQEQWDEVVDGFLVEPQNRGRAGTTWEPSHEWRLAEATPNSRGLPWFTLKRLGYSVDPQNRGRRLDEEVQPPKPVQPPRRAGQTARGRSDCPGRCRREASTRRTRIGIASLVSRLSKVAFVGHPSDGENQNTSKFALEGHVSLDI
jgi:hypothetical protein